MPDPEATEALWDELFKHNRRQQERLERHPLLRAAMDLLQQLHVIFRDTDPRWAASVRTLFQGAGDAMGGLAQALSGRAHEEDGPDDYGLRVTQLKRARRGVCPRSPSHASLRRRRREV